MIEYFQDGLRNERCNLTIRVSASLLRSTRHTHRIRNGGMYIWGCN